MRVPEVLALLGIDEAYLRELVLHGRLQPVPRAGEPYFQRAEVEALRSKLGVRARDIRLKPGAPGPSDASEGARAGSPSDSAYSRHAVLIGVSNFCPGVPPLRHAEHDASALRDVLADPECGIFEPANLRLLTGNAATIQAVRTTLGEFLTRSVAPEDFVLLFVATHGVVLGNEGYLLLADSSPQNPFGTALPMGELARWLHMLPARQVVVILDACHAGGATPSTEWSQRLQSFGGQSGRVVLAACGAGEQSLELDADGHGLFTKHLLEALRGESDLNRDGVCDALEVFTYLRDGVAREAAGFGREQTPTWWGTIGQRVLLARNPVISSTATARIRRKSGPRLVLLDSLGPRARFRLSGALTSIGRHPDCDVQILGDGTLSRRHGVFKRGSEGWLFAPEPGARARTWVNGRALERDEVALEDGALLRLGRTEVLFFRGQASPHESTASGRHPLVSRGEDLAPAGVRTRTSDGPTEAPSAPRISFAAAGGEAGRASEREAPGVAVLSGHRRGLSAVAFSPSGRTLATGARDGWIRVYRGGAEQFWLEAGAVRLPPLKSTFKKLMGRAWPVVQALAFLPGRDLLLSGGGDGFVRVFNPDGDELQALEQAGEVTALAVDPEGRHLAVGSERVVRIYTVKDWTLRHAIEGGTPQDLAFSADGHSLWACFADGRLLAWEPSSARLRERFGLDDQCLNALACVPAPGRQALLAVATAKGELRLVGNERDERLLELLDGRGRPKALQALALDAEGALIATGGEDGKLWLVGRERVVALKGHDGPISAIAVTSDGELVVTASEDFTARVWPARRLLI